MLPILYTILQALALTSVSGQTVASNIPSRTPYDEPARGQGRRILLYGRPDLALTVLGEPANGTAVGIAYTLNLSDANSARQLFDTNVHDDDDEADQFDYNDDDDQLRLRGTQLCVTMSGNNAFTLQSCNDDRDDDVNWVQDWDFDEPDGPKSWVRIEDDDDDSRCITAQLSVWTDDTAQLTFGTCSNDSEAQRFYQELPGQGTNAITTLSASTTSARAPGSATQQSTAPAATSSLGPTGTALPGAGTTPNAAARRANVWGAGLIRLIAKL